MRSIETIKQASLFTAIKTPYLENGEIDFTAYHFLLTEQVNAGVEGIIVGGTTGEGHLLNADELQQLISYSVKQVGEQLIIVGNTGGNNTAQAVAKTKQGFAAGMDAALQVNPYYGQTSEQGLLAHFNALLDCGSAFIYNVAGRTGQDITPDIMLKIAQHPQFIGVKECSGNARIEHYESQGIACWSGNDDQAHDARHQHKAHGVISVASNLIPRAMRQLMDTPNNELNQQLKPLINWLFCEPNPIAINTALMMTNAVKPVFRLPYTPLNNEQQQTGIALIKQLNEVQFTGSEPVLLTTPVLI